MSDIIETVSDERPADWPVDVEQMHFRLTDQLLGPLDLSCDRGYVVRSYDFAYPETRAVTYNNALEDGAFDLTKFLGPRAVTLELTLKVRASVNDTGPRLVIPSGPGSGTEVSEAMLRDRIRAYLHPQRRPRLIFTEHQDKRCRQVLLRGSESAAAFAQARYNACSASWVAPRTYIESYRVKTAIATIDEDVPAALSLDIFNEGNAPAYWAARLQGETMKPRISLVNAVYGTSYLQLDYDRTNPGDVVTVDSFSRSVLVNNQPIGFRYVNDQSQWFRIPPGPSTLVFDAFTAAGAGYEYGTWVTGQFQGPGSPNAATGQWSDRLTNLPAPAPPEDPQGPPFAWSTRPGESGGVTPSGSELRFAYTDTWL